MSLGLQSQQSVASQTTQDTSQAQGPNITGPSAAGSNSQAQEKLAGVSANQVSGNQVSGNPALQLNSRGKAVKTLQARLNELGAALDADGEFGPATMRAVRGFQNANSISDDGIVGPRTASIMNGNPAKIGSKPKGKGGQGGEGGNHQSSGGEDSKDLGAGMKEGQLSANFSLAEFASHDGATTPANVVANLRRLAAQLEILREALGNANISINSGYRSPKHNRSVGGAEHSQHLYGIAADIVVSGYSPKQVANTIEKLIKEGKMTQGGIGRYSTFVHYDIRGSAARW